MLLAAAPVLDFKCTQRTEQTGHIEGVSQLHRAADLIVEVHAEGNTAMEGQLGLVGGVGVGGGSGRDPAVLVVDLGIDSAIPDSLGHNVLRVLDRGQPWTYTCLSDGIPADALCSRVPRMAPTFSSMLEGGMVAAAAACRKCHGVACSDVVIPSRMGTSGDACTGSLNIQVLLARHASTNRGQVSVLGGSGMAEARSEPTTLQDRSTCHSSVPHAAWADSKWDRNDRNKGAW